MPQFLPFAATGANGDPNFPENTGGGGGNVVRIDEFTTPGTYSVTAPDDAVVAYVIAAGGGGGGGQGGNGENVEIFCARGGNAAESRVDTYTVGAGKDITTSLSIVIGAGGAGATGNTFNNAATATRPKTVGNATTLTAGSFSRSWSGGNILRSITGATVEFNYRLIVNTGQPQEGRPTGGEGVAVTSSATSFSNTVFAGDGGSNILASGGLGSGVFTDGANRLGGNGGGGAGFVSGANGDPQVNTTPQNGGNGGNGGMKIIWYSAYTVNGVS